MTSDGKIDEMPCDARFRDLLKNDHQIIVYNDDRHCKAVSGRLGDHVQVEMTPHDLWHGASSIANERRIRVCNPRLSRPFEERPASARYIFRRPTLRPASIGRP